MDFGFGSEKEYHLRLELDFGSALEKAYDFVLEME
jgi:hypothetical protein